MLVRAGAGRKRRRQGESLHLGYAQRNLAVRGAPRSGNRQQHRGRRSRHALGFRMGARPVRDLGRGRRGAHGEGTRAGRKADAAAGEKVLGSPKKVFYRKKRGATSFFDLPSGALKPLEEPPGIIILKSLKDRTAVVQENSGASLIDLGDAVLCCEFHAKMNAIGGDIFAMLSRASRAWKRNSKPW